MNLRLYKYGITIAILLLSYSCSNTTNIARFKSTILRQCKLDINNWVINPDSIAVQLDLLGSDERRAIDSLQEIFNATRNYSVLKEINYILSHQYLLDKNLNRYSPYKELQKHYFVNKF